MTLTFASPGLLTLPEWHALHDSHGIPTNNVAAAAPPNYVVRTLGCPCGATINYVVTDDAGNPPPSGDAEQ